MAAAHFEGCLFVDGFTPESITPKDSNGLEVPVAGIRSLSTSTLLIHKFGIDTRGEIEVAEVGYLSFNENKPFLGQERHLQHGTEEKQNVDENWL